MHVKDIKATVSRVKAVSVGVGGFIGRHKRASIAVGAALLLAGPLVTGDGELVFLNAVGLGLGALLLRRFARPNGRQRTGRTRQEQRQQATRGAPGAADGTSNTKRRRTTMTTQATTIGGTGTRPRASLEELVDRLMAALFRAEPEAAMQTETPSVAGSVHEARRLRQAGDVDGALAVLAGMDAAKAEPHQARWAFAEWTDLVKRRSGGANVMVYSQSAGTGRRADSPRRRDACGRCGPGDALAPRQGRLGAQPAGAQAPERGCVMVVANASVDIPALKARHPLGDTVEASGVRLRGRGRVRQGVCPFHDEAEGSFTVYSDSERFFYCFGCGEGGDVLDFIQRVENLSLPEAIARLDGSPGLAPRAAVRPAGSAAPQVRRAAPKGPRLADGGGAVLRRTAAPSFGGAGVPGLAGRRPARGSPPGPRLCAGQRAARVP